MEQKPMIRHCRNCKWHKRYALLGIHCEVKYQYIDDYQARKKALLCKYYTQKESDEQ